MKTLEDLLFEDFVLCFYGVHSEYREGILRGWILELYMQPFPKNEYYSSLIKANYIKD